MIQVNLLPDVKREYLHAQQVKHLFTVVSILATLLAVSLMGLLFAYVQFIQPRHRANLQKDIDAGISQLKSKDDGVKIVTVQGVLEQLPTLQDQKLITSRLFGYITEFTPRDVSYSSVTLDLSANTLTLGGQTTTLERANALANNLKSATFAYRQDDADKTAKPFSNIVFSNLGKTEQADGGNDVSFSIILQLDPIMFNQSISNARISVNASSEELLLPSDKPFNNAGAGATP